MNGKRIILTGAASGIGEATKIELERQGSRVVGLDINAEGDLIACDVGDQESVDNAVAEAIGRLGGLDVLINNAGLATPQSAGLPPDARALQVIDVNMVGPWRVTSAALSELRKSRGRVVNVASGMAFVALPFAPAYAMGKHGIVAYSGALRLEHGDAISVTTVYPGVVRTPIHRDSEEFGLTIEGTSPTETLESAVNALVRASLGKKPARDITTTRSGLIANGMSRHLPRKLVDHVVLSQFRKAMKRKKFRDPDTVIAQFARRVTQKQT